MWNLFVDDRALRRPLFQTAFEGLPHIHASRLNPLALRCAQLRPEELIQGVFLPLPAEPKRFTRFQIAHYRDEFIRFPQINLIHSHLPQSRLLSPCRPTLQVTKINRPYGAFRQLQSPRHLPCRCTLASLAHRILKAFAERALARQLRHFLHLRTAVGTSHSAQFHDHRYPVFTPRKVAHFPFHHLMDAAYMLAAPGAYPLLRARFPAHP